MTIKKLPTLLSNQIAAGEVIERPSSVVKELIENAIDAQAKTIEIRIENSGLNLIQVIDDGIGMSSEDAPLAFERHATSKIMTSRDLFKIKTLGFRGEALPSIAAVSEVRLETSDGTTGTSLSLVDGKIIEQKVMALRKGTTVTVEHLFYNTPARLKYLKSPQTELSQITNIVNREALGHPDIRFIYQNEKRILLKTNGKGEVKESFAAVYGFHTAKEMLTFKKETWDFTVEGLISPTTLTRSSNQYLSIFLNGRYIKNYVLSQAVIKGYGSKLMIGRYPLGAVYITIDSQLLDVNVHPTKQEVRISKEDQLYQLLVEAVQESLQGSNRIPEFKTKPVLTEDETKISNLPFEVEAVGEQEELIVDYLSPNNQNQSSSNSSIEENQGHPKTFPRLDYIGQMEASYLVCSDGKGMVLIDQHAAHERVNLERFRKEIASDNTQLQPLLMPILLEYSEDEKEKVEEHLATLAAVGLKLEAFGERTFAIQEHPAWMGEKNLQRNIEDLIELLINDPQASVEDFRESTAIMMSCRLAIKAHHPLSKEEAIGLIDRLAQCENPYNCSHGRPSLLSFENREIERSFKRIQDPHVSPKNRHLH